MRRLLKKGIPQGGILLPFAWNDNMDQLLALFDIFDLPTEDEDLEAREQRRD